MSAWEGSAMQMAADDRARAGECVCEWQGITNERCRAKVHKTRKPAPLMAMQTCPCTIPWLSPTPRPICPTHGQPEPSLSRVVAEAVNGPSGPFMAPLCFVPRSDFEGLPAKWPSDTAWKADTFPQETQ